MRSINNRLKRIASFAVTTLILIVIGPLLPQKALSDVASDLILAHYTLHDATGELDINQIVNVQFPLISDRAPYTTGNVWHKLIVDAPKTDKALVLQVSPKHRNHVTVYIPYGDKSDKWDIKTTGNGVPWYKRTSYFKSNSFLISLTNRTEIFVRVSSIGNTTVKISTIFLSDLVKQESVNEIWRSGYLIVLFTIIILAAYAYFRFQRTSALLFLVSHVLYFIFACSIFDYLAPLFPTVALTDDIIAYIIPVITLFVGMYHRSVLGQRNSNKILLRIIDLFISLVALVIAITIFYDPSFGHELNNGIMVLLSLLFIVTAFTTKQNENPTRVQFTTYYVLLFISICVHILPIMIRVHILPIMIPSMRLIIPSNSTMTLTHILYSSIVFGHLLYVEYRHDQENRFKMQSRLLLANLNIELQKLKRIEQENFTAMLAHELKNPLASIKLTCDILRSVVKSEGERFDRIDASVNTINVLVEKFVLNDKIERALVDPKSERIDLSVMLKKVEIINSNKKKFNICLGSKDLSICGDPILVETAIVNIIENALKYSPPASIIHIKATVSEKHICINIKNRIFSGVNLDNHIFEKHVRGQNKTNAPGTGLGLYLVKWIMEKHNGRVILNSDKHEASFVLEFPRH